ncbi:polyprenyl synthetase family protein [Nocardiopsis changdeensis]|uniref:Polyprenyl synthetase family protein n=1 Tax=Nocardiopsis changdeensis TaxID=2831969 RepID=A0ABX8BRZ4_9ACTN|nr:MULTISPECIES: polyprenyl synthetase family protein [Nocardiopsis]QUX24029.1 polyprenyl synthetase family protein [Nocardiopsis changdeensis]QYX34425.1 polyprenyl synthetase family protein [Nocardiopsis sp. MT53]
MTRPGEADIEPVLNGPGALRIHHVHGDPRPALDQVLRDHLRRRLLGAEQTDPEFAAGTAAQTAAFTLEGGKRLRSSLAWWGWRAGGGPVSGPVAHHALVACASLELLQTCALVHDDVMDGSATRRGAPCVHRRHEDEHRENAWSGEARRYGESLAVLVGDLALAWADDMLAEALPGVPRPEAGRAVWREIRTEMIAGQYLDVRGQARGSRSESLALRIDRLKTASYTVERPLHLGAAMAGAPPAVAEALRSYGRDVGVAFQLADDLAGAYGDSGSTGKPVGDDLLEGKTTLLLALGTRLARESGDTAGLDLLERVGAGADPAEAAAVLEGLGARERVAEHCRGLAARGVSHLDGIDLPEPVRDVLAGLAARLGEAA